MTDVAEQAAVGCALAGARPIFVIRFPKFSLVKFKSDSYARSKNKRNIWL